MNDFIQQLHSHRSIRKFSDKDISQSDLELILSAAASASSSGNMQSFSVVVTKDRAMKEKMYQAHFEQSMLMDAPIFLTFCADFYHMRRWLKLSEAANNFDNYMSFMIASIDAILASQNAALAAESLGMGLCYMGTTLASAGEIGEILALPENVVPVVGFALGYPDEAPDLRKRLPLESLVHYEKYHKYSDEEVLEIYREREVEGMKRYRDNPRLNQMIKDVGAKNLAQVYTQAKYTEESHLKYSEDLIAYLKRQNFF
ncbi:MULTISPECIES: nitroreductase family protein [unclassified Halobacteriovorax]|uniref:nitroreductase family protein n=1 Tax=unclassified Halobacteriovorax TaxID=2639665 RepID=UPI003999DE9C